MLDSEDTQISSMDVVTHSGQRVVECESLLIEILTKLHCREAIKSKLVCKHWNSIISSDYFVTAFNHRRHDPSLPPIPHDPSYRLIFQFLPDHHSAFEYESFSIYGALFSAFEDHKYEFLSIIHCGSNSQPLLLRSLDLGFLPCWTKRTVAVVASCADLILCTFMCNPNPQFTNYFVCNVQTKQWFALPPAPNIHGDDYYAVGFLCIPSPCSLCRGHDGVDNSRYKFMVLRVHRGPRRYFTLSEVELFMSEEGEWTKHEVSSPLELHWSHKGNMVAYKGMLHWLNYPHILVFDHYGQISRVIDIKFIGFPYSSNVPCFDVSQDRLRIVHVRLYGDQQYYSIWELEDYDKERWIYVKTDPTGESGAGYVPPDGNAAYCTEDQEDGSTCLWFCNMLSKVSDRKLVTRYQERGSFITVESAHRVTDQWWPTPVPSLQVKSSRTTTLGSGVL